MKLLPLAILSALSVSLATHEGDAGCPAELPENDSPCFEEAFFSCEYETDDYCCPETGVCSIVGCFCSSFGNWICDTPFIPGLCPTLEAACPAELPPSFEFQDVCMANGLPVQYFCDYGTDVCCPETGDCADALCVCDGTESSTNCFFTGEVECPSACPVEAPQEFTDCTVSGAFECVYRSNEAVECFEELQVTSCDCSFGSWFCFNSTDVYLGEECPIECPPDPPLDFTSCNLPSGANCTYETDDYCCPETGECSAIVADCFSGTWFTRGLSLTQDCPTVQSTCPAEPPSDEELEDLCMANGFPIFYDCPYESDICCPETGECADLFCNCFGTDPGSCSFSGPFIECPSVCPAEAPEVGAECTLSDVYVCAYPTPEDPECFEEITVTACACFDTWDCIDFAETYVVDSCFPSPVAPVVPVAPPSIAPVPVFMFGDDDGDDDDDDDDAGKKGSGKKERTRRTAVLQALNDENE